MPAFPVSLLCQKEYPGLNLQPTILVNWSIGHEGFRIVRWTGPPYLQDSLVGFKVHRPICVLQQICKEISVKGHQGKDAGGTPAIPGGAIRSTTSQETDGRPPLTVLRRLLILLILSIDSSTIRLFNSLMIRPAGWGHSSPLNDNSHCPKIPNLEDYSVGVPAASSAALS